LHRHNLKAHLLKKLCVLEYLHLLEYDYVYESIKVTI